MKQLSHSIINSTKSLLGRWTKVTTLGCMLALVFLVATSAQPQSSGKARPFKATGIFTSVYDEGSISTGTFKVLGNATHLGKIVFAGTWAINGGDFEQFTYLIFHIVGTYTAANGDTIQIDCPDWVTDYDSSGTPTASFGLVNIIGGTGRCANASGSYAGNISPGNPAIFTADGTISY